MNETYTPGPWRRRKDGRGNIVWQALGREIMTHSREDASLIAAAPDLLEAAKHALAWMNDIYGKFPAESEAGQATAMLRAAIAKAEGRP